MKILYIIPARGGSKGIPHKNIKHLAGKPLIYYSIDVARELTTDENICVSSDDEEIIKVVENYGLKVPFIRPNNLSTDFASTEGVLLHAIEFYNNKGLNYDAIVLLQPTSPFRKKEHIQEALIVYNEQLDMVVSVKYAASNPYYNCYEENLFGYLEISKGNGNLTRRQDAPYVWEYNGSIYIINVPSLKEKGLSGFSKIKKYLMDEIYSIDLDTLFDWKIAELILSDKTVDI